MYLRIQYVFLYFSWRLYNEKVYLYCAYRCPRTILHERFAAEPLSSQEGGTTAQESITPFWVNTLSIIPSISGSAGTYSCSINGVSGTTKISATLVLYEKGWLGGYTEVARTSHTTYSASFFKSDSYSFSSGKTYKLEVSGTVTRNGYAEPVSATIEQKI